MSEQKNAFYKLGFWRTCQYATYEEAGESGGLRTYPVEPPISYIVDGNFRTGSIGDLMDVIDMACDMMEHKPPIAYALIDYSGTVVALDMPE